MFRFVDNFRAVRLLSTAVDSLAFIAIVFFGAPVLTFFWAIVGLFAFLNVCEDLNRRQGRRR